MAKKVLLVDDVSMFLELEKNYLQLSAVNVLTARDGKEALKICQAERPDMVFMDLHMPIMNGADCCRAIKENPELASTTVVLITSEGKEADRMLCLKAGCDGFLTKPLDRHLFLQEARKLLPSIDRRDRRLTCRIRVKYSALGIPLSGFIVNMSQNGVYIATDAEVQTDALVDLVFALPEPSGAVIQTRARVAWTNTRKSKRKPSLPDGIGVEFISPGNEAAREILRFIESENSTLPVWRAS